MNNWSDKPYYLSLSPLVAWGMVERPIDWTGEFGRPAALEVEIGTGNGEALVRRALAHPERDFVGIDTSWGSIKRVLRRVGKSGLTNVRVMQIDVQEAFKRFIRPQTVNRITCLFPPPWPKDRHEDRRIFSRAFLRMANNRLKDEGRFRIVTDFRPLFDWALTQVPETGFTAHWQEISARFNTKYERKWRENGQESFFEIVLDKETHFPVPLLEDVPLQSYRLKHFDPQNFQPAGCTGSVTVQFKEFLYDPDQRKLMFRALVIDEGLTQELWLKVVAVDDYWLLGLARNNQLIPSDGVKAALELALEAAEKSLA